MSVSEAGSVSEPMVFVLHGQPKTNIPVCVCLLVDSRHSPAVKSGCEICLAGSWGEEIGIELCGCCLSFLLERLSIHEILAQYGGIVLATRYL